LSFQIEVVVSEYGDGTIGPARRLRRALRRKAPADPRARRPSAAATYGTASPPHVRRGKPRADRDLNPTQSPRLRCDVRTLLAPCFLDTGRRAAMHRRRTERSLTHLTGRVPCGAAAPPCPCRRLARGNRVRRQMSCVANTDLVTPAAARRQSAVVVEARRLLGALYADHGRPRRFTVAPQFRRLEPACSCWWHHHGRNRITLACVKTRSLLEPSVHVDFRNSRECESNDALHTLYCTSKPSAWQLN